MSIMLTALSVLGPIVSADQMVTRTTCNYNATSNATIHDFSEKELIKDNVVNLSDHRGKVVLVVNVATY